MRKVDGISRPWDEVIDVGFLSDDPGSKSRHPPAHLEKDGDVLFEGGLRSVNATPAFSSMDVAFAPRRFS
jgi:hypothetical protein